MSIRYRKLSNLGDYVFGNGQKDFYRDEPNAPAQAVVTRLLLFLGEWFLDIDEGTPYLQGILGKHPTEVANITVRNRVLATQAVTDLTDFVSTIEPNTRNYSASFTIDTIYGPTPVQVDNYVNF